MSTLVIEKDHPIPSGPGVGRFAFAFQQMKVGESFVIEKEAYPTAWAAAKKAGVVILRRGVDKFSVRIWRVS